jgi:preprotein translocase subunit SecF
MSIVIFFLFKTFVPSIAVILSAFADIIMPLAVVDFLGIKLSAAGIAAFLMLVGYSVDTDILLTTRALKKKEGTLNERIFGAFKTGTFMTLTALAAVLPAFFLITGLPDSFRQIFLILAFGLIADLINTWLMNTGIIKWYCDKKRII